MWRSILAVVLLPSIVWAQQQSLPVPEMQENAATKDPRPTYKALIEPRTIRPGKTEKAVVVLLLSQGLVVSRNESSRDLFPMKIEFEERDGLTATSFSFPPDQRRSFAFHDEAMRKEKMLESFDEVNHVDSSAANFPKADSRTRIDTRVTRDAAGRVTIRDTRVRVQDGNSLRVEFKLKASKSARLGEHLLRAKVTLQSISDSGVLAPQQIEVQLPVTVVDHDAKAKNTKTARSDAGGTPILIWILAPLLIPLMVVMAIVCGIRGEDCSC
jgi:hypothetical protein